MGEGREGERGIGGVVYEKDARQQVRDAIVNFTELVVLVRGHPPASVWRGWDTSGMRWRRVRRVLVIVYLTDTFGGAFAVRVTGCVR